MIRQLHLVYGLSGTIKYVKPYNLNIRIVLFCLQALWTLEVTVEEHIMSKPGLLYTLVIIINADILILLTKAKNILVQKEGKKPMLQVALKLWQQLGPEFPLSRNVAIKHDITWPHCLVIAIPTALVAVVTLGTQKSLSDNLKRRGVSPRQVSQQLSAVDESSGGRGGLLAASMGRCHGHAWRSAGSWVSTMEYRWLCECFGWAKEQWGNLWTSHLLHYWFSLWEDGRKDVKAGHVTTGKLRLQKLPGPFISPLSLVPS